MARTTPVVQGEVLIWQGDDQKQSLTVGSPAWYAWFEDASTFAHVADKSKCRGLFQTGIPSKGTDSERLFLVIALPDQNLALYHWSRSCHRCRSFLGQPPVQKFPHG